MINVVIPSIGKAVTSVQADFNIKVYKQGKTNVHLVNAKDIQEMQAFPSSSTRLHIQCDLVADCTRGSSDDESYYIYNVDVNQMQSTKKP